MRCASSERLTGADGVVGGDQLQYLAWARDAGSHGLAGEPVHAAAGRPRLRPAAVHAQRSAVAARVAPLSSRTGCGSRWRSPSCSPGSRAWVAPAARRPRAALGGDRARPVPVHAAGRGRRLARARARRLPRAGCSRSRPRCSRPASCGATCRPRSPSDCCRSSLLAAERPPTGALAAPGALATRRAAALLAAWLHPWQGAILAAVAAVLAAWGTPAQRRALARRRARRRAPARLLPAAARSSIRRWKLASRNELVAAPAAREPRDRTAAGARARRRRASVDPGGALAERALLLWIPASLLTYFAVGSFPSHALESASLPLAVLCVRGVGAPAAAGARWLDRDRARDAARNGLRGPRVSRGRARPEPAVLPELFRRARARLGRCTRRRPAG